MLLVHNRAHALPVIIGQMESLGCAVELQITLNRPSAEVLGIVNEALHSPPRHTVVRVHQAPFPPLGEPGRERFMELRRWQYERLAPSEYGVIWDDDHFLEDTDETRRILPETPDLVYATKKFFWDEPDQVAVHLPVHRSVFFFRRLPDDQFPLDRVIHAPARIHDTGTDVRDLTGSLLDYGYLHSEDRARAWAEYKRAGKIDAATTALIGRPILVPYDGPNRLEPRHR